VATSEQFKDKAGESKEKTEWHNVVAWGQTAEEIARQFQKGDSIAISGSLRLNTYEKGGAKNRVEEIEIAKAQENFDGGSRNEIRLVGVVREDANAREASNGRPMTTLSVATKTTAPGRGGESRAREDWHSVTMWGKVATAGKELRAGDTIAITGSLRHRTVGDRKLSAVECQKFRLLERAQERVQDRAVVPRTRRPSKGVERGM
jgi:single-stranded DNA-binding protein